MSQKLSDIHWKGDSALRTVTEEAITPAGVENANELDHYLAQFGTLNQEE